jgi:hypothetical protein
MRKIVSLLERRMFNRCIAFLRQLGGIGSRRQWFALFSYGHLAFCQNEILMKTHIFGAVLLFFCFGCASPESNQLSPQQKDQIKREGQMGAD